MTTLRAVKDEIIRLAVERNGVKTSELAVLLPAEMLIFDIDSLILELINNIEVTACSYVSPTRNFFVHYFLLPSNVKAALHNVS